jgi:hypothetical protein
MSLLKHAGINRQFFQYTPGTVKFYDKALIPEIYTGHPPFITKPVQKAASACAGCGAKKTITTITNKTICAYCKGELNGKL